MLFKCFTLYWDSVLENFDETLVCDFIKDKTILSMRDYFYVHNNLPRLTVVIYYQLAVSSTLSSYSAKQKQKPIIKDIVESILKTEDKPLYDHLRNWRNELGKQQGLPPYVIASNEQLALIARQQPQSLAQLAKLDGWGQAKVKQYGQLILDQLSVPLSKKLPTPKKSDDDATTET